MKLKSVIPHSISIFHLEPLKRQSSACMVQIQSYVLASGTLASWFFKTLFIPSGQSVYRPMSGLPGVWVLLVPSPSPAPAKVTWQGAAADGSQSAGPDGPLCTRCPCWFLLKVRHHEWCWEAKCSSCLQQIWNTNVVMTRKWKEKMCPLAARERRTMPDWFPMKWTSGCIFGISSVFRPGQVEV